MIKLPWICCVFKHTAQSKNLRLCGEHQQQNTHESVRYDEGKIINNMRKFHLNSTVCIKCCFFFSFSHGANRFSSASTAKSENAESERAALKLDLIFIARKIRIFFVC